MYLKQINDFETFFSQIALEIIFIIFSQSELKITIISRCYKKISISNLLYVLLLLANNYIFSICSYFNVKKDVLVVSAIRIKITFTKGCKIALTLTYLFHGVSERKMLSFIFL